MKESEVKKAVIEYFREQDFFVPHTEFNIGVKPDVVGFKWINPYEIMNVAVECKPYKRPRTLIETGLTQAREYQAAFQYVYLAAPKLDKKSSDAVKNVLSFLRMGLLAVAIAHGKLKASEELEPNVSSRLDYSKFVHKIRQRAAAILTYNDVFGKHFDINVQSSDDVHCFMKDVAANFLLSNAYPSGDYFFGICIEQQENVKRALGHISHQKLYKMLVELPGKYLIDLEYIDTYYPQEVSWSILSKPVQRISFNDIKWILDYCKEKNWKTRLLIMRKVWDKDELLSREEHKERIDTVQRELLPLRHKLVR